MFLKDIPQPSVKFILYSIVFAFLIYQIAKWLLNYIYKYKVVNKAKGHPSYPVLPFIGNAHHFKRKYGNNHFKHGFNIGIIMIYVLI